MLFWLFFRAIVKALEEIEEGSHDGRVASEANGLINQLTKFEFILCLIVSAIQVVDTTVKTLRD